MTTMSNAKIREMIALLGEEAVVGALAEQCEIRSRAAWRRPGQRAYTWRSAAQKLRAVEQVMARARATQEAKHER